MISTAETSRAAARMASLLYADLEVDLRPSQIEEFIQKRWARIAPLAHAIHEAPDDTKATAPPPPETAKPPTESERVERAIQRLRLMANGMRNNMQGFQASTLDDIVAELEQRA